jgi:aspartate/methionine/tyrosine aminotransferase
MGAFCFWPCEICRLFRFPFLCFEGANLNNPAPATHSPISFHPRTHAGLELLCACSFAKNMGLYGERIGALHAVTATTGEAQVVLSQLKAIIRPMYSSPPAHYAKVAGRILGDAALMAEWSEELAGMAARIQRMRALFKEALLVRALEGIWKTMGLLASMPRLSTHHLSPCDRPSLCMYVCDSARSAPGRGSTWAGRRACSASRGSASSTCRPSSGTTPSTSSTTAGGWVGG